MSKHPTRYEIAADFKLWGEYVDTLATMTEEEFNAMSVEQKVWLQAEISGPESIDAV